MLDLIALLLRSNADIVTASPYHPLAGPLEVPRWRLLLSKGASALYAAISPVKLYCYTSLFRAYRREWARREFLQSDGFLAVTEILVAAALRGAKIIEYPMSLSTRRYGQSKMKVARTTLAHLRLMSQVALRRGQFSRSAKMRNTVLESDPGGGRGDQDLN
jgi:dolichol-phosphate mannosyltransferase